MSRRLARARQARSASESPCALVRGSESGDLDAVGVGEWFEDQWAVARLEALGRVLWVAAVGGDLRKRFGPVDDAHGCGFGDRVDDRV